MEVVDIVMESRGMERLNPSVPYMPFAFSESACLHPNYKIGQKNLKIKGTKKWKHFK